MALNLEIITPDEVIFSGEVAMVVAPGAEGEFGVLPNHAPLIAELQQGELRIYDKVEAAKPAQIFKTEGGFVQVMGTKCTILSDKIAAE
ncbi:MAG: ATP synthase F1 subunit epsilon [Alphaproteobacteria bacterium CG11_big_fil_rev_8_21_14_0_20_44_7]|nr:MAG: ATP synthase F1 subunit epsilon [Alphaproteobacteria bacterium CG11_big_fil_rev_8_21_14_0_20_44_7]